MLNWRQEIVAICLAAMEVCWLRPALVFLVQGQGDDALPPLAIMALLLMAYWITRVLIASRLSLLLTRVLILGCATLSIVGVIWFWRYDAYFPLDPTWVGLWLGNLGQVFNSLYQPDLFAILAGVYLWWRGIVMTRAGQSFGRAFDAFRVGLVVLLVAGLGQSLSGLELQVIPYAFEFFIFGLAAIAIGRLDEIDQRGQLRLRQDRYWLLILVSAIALVLALGLASAALFGADLGGVLLAILGPVGWVFQVLVYLVLLILGYFAQFLVGLLRIAFPPLAEGTSIESAVGSPEVPATPVVVEPYGMPPVIQFSVQVMVGLALALLALYILARAIQRWRQTASAGVEEIHESIFSMSTLGDDLTGLLRSLWDNLADRLRRPGAGLPLPDEDDPLYASFAIRRIYTEVLATAAAVGLVRAPNQTPHEYLPRLQLALPQHTRALQDLTSAYTRARYDALRATRPELKAARAAWDQLRDDLRHLPPPAETQDESAHYTENVDEMAMLLMKGRPGA